jgi:peptidoglycan/LPS O-acetylase OafA/YrhL
MSHLLVSTNAAVEDEGLGFLRLLSVHPLANNSSAGATNKSNSVDVPWYYILVAVVGILLLGALFHHCCLAPSKTKRKLHALVQEVRLGNEEL